MFFKGFVAVVLAGFLYSTDVVLSRFGYLGFFQTATANAVVGQMFLDLVISLALIAVWIYRDARRLGVSPWPFLVIGALFGAAGPLGYLLRRPRQARSEEREEDLFGVPARVAAPLLALFSAFSLYVLVRHGYASFAFYAGANEATQLLFFDLVICTVFLCVLLVREARAQGGSYAPFLALALFFGSVSPLLYLAARRLSRRGLRLSGLAAILAGGFAMTLGSGDADLRNELVRRDDEGSERRGRERLAELARRHGLAAWRQHETMETVARDVWPAGGPWWPQDDQRFRAQALLGTFTSRVELLDGRSAGEIWGLQSWSPYKVKDARSEPAAVAAPDGALTFYLPTLQYFNELPFRLLSATVVRDAGAVRHRGRTYDLVFATWKQPEPRDDVDHYVLWIDRESGLLARARYTVRESLSMMTPFSRRLLRPLVAGTIHFEDYREVEGVQVPFVQTVTLPPPELTRYPLSEHFFHRLTLETAAFDTVPRETLLPRPGLEAPGDRKPPNE